MAVDELQTQLTPEAQRFVDLRSRYHLNNLTLRNTISFDKAVELCRRFLYEINKELDVTREEARETTLRDIDRFVNNLKESVDGYEDLSQLREALKNSITDYDIITPLLNHPEVDEVRINSRDRIFYERKGRVFRFKKAFATHEDLKRVIERLIGTNVRLNKHETPFVNARSLEGWRINATHPDIVHQESYTSVIRKPKKYQLMESDLISNQTLTPNMLSLLRFMPLIYASWWTIGPTGSGKTTINEMISQGIRYTDRTVLIENPNELRFEQYDTDGNVINDFIQLRAQTGGEHNPNFPNTNNLLENALRQTPRWIGVGEIRSKEEFKTMLTAMLTGHYIFTSFHSDEEEDAMYRFLSSYLSAAIGEPPELVMRNLCSNMDLINACRLFPDVGYRRMVGISEVVGSDGTKPLLNQIYRYERLEVMDDGRVRSAFIRCNPISEKLQRKFRYAGIPDKKYRYWTQPPSNPKGDIELEFIEEPIREEDALDV